MHPSPAADPCAFDCTLDIAAPAETVYAAFFAPDHLAAWWGVRASVTVARPLGVYALDWPLEPETDAVLGRLGGVFYGVVIDTHPGREFFLADAYWLPADGDPIGPMALHVTCEPTAGGTRLRVEQSGCDDSPRWRRFYRMVGARWTQALGRLKTQLETHG